MKNFKVGEILPANHESVTYLIASETKIGDKQVTRIFHNHQMKIFHEREINGQNYIAVERQSYDGELPYYVLEKDMDTLFKKSGQVAIALQNFLNVKEGDVSKVIINEVDFGDISLSEKFVKSRTDLFRIEDENNSIKVGDYVKIVNLENCKHGIIGYIGRLKKIDVNSSYSYILDCEGTYFRRENIVKSNEQEFNEYSSLIIEGYKPESTEEGIKFGCNTHTLANLESYLHFLEMNRTAKMSVQGTEVTPELIKKLINLHKNQ